MSGRRVSGEEMEQDADPEAEWGDRSLWVRLVTG